MSNLLPLMAAAGNVTTGADTDADFENTVLLINGDGAADGGQNNTFLDTSGNGHAITRNGNVTQGSFSPFSQDEGKWGVQFDGADGAFVRLPNDTTTDLSTGDFTIECWVYYNSFINDAKIYIDITNASNYAQLTFSTTLGLRFVVSSSTVISQGTNDWNTGQWYHVALVRNGSTFTIYRDGVSIGTGTRSTSIGNFNAKCIGGANGFASTTMNGYISNFRMVKGTALYTSSFTPPNAPLTDISGTSALTCQSNRFKDNSTNNHTITPNGDPKVVTFSPFPETTAYTRSTINQGAMYFDGTGDKLTTSGASIGDFGTGDFTIEAWINPDALSGYNSIIADDTYSSGSTPNAWCFYLDGTSLDGWKGGSSILTGGTLTVGQWHHVAWTRSSGTMYLFLDGQQVATASDSTSFNHGDIIVASNVGNYYLDGHLSNVRIVKGTAVYTADFTVPTEPLTAITNTSLLTCQAAGAVDNSSNAHTITVNGDAKQSVFVPFGERSVEFDGTGDWLTSSADVAFGTGDFTLECWVYITNAGTGYKGILSCFTSSIGPVIELYNGNWAYYMTGSGVDTSVSATTNTWHHVALTRSGSTFYYFVDGKQIATGSNSTNYTCNLVTIGTLGSPVYTTGYELTGYVSNARVIKGTALYTSAFTPPTEPLTAITNTSLLTCQNSVFQDNSGNAHAITVNGDPQASNNLPFGERSVYFDGTGDYLTFPEATLSGDFTLETWVQPTALSGTRLLFSSTTQSNVQIPRIQLNGGVYVYINGTELNAGGTATALANTDEWHHFALTRSGTTVYAFVDGEEIWNTTFSSSFNVGVLGAFYLSGSLYSTPYYFGGYLSNTRIVNGTALYTADFTVPTEPFTAVTNTSHLFCQDAVFQDNSGNAHAITVVGNAEASNNIPFAPTTTYGIQQYLDDAYTVANRGGSGYFDGTGDYLSVATFAPAGGFTVEAWVYKTASVKMQIFASNLSPNNRQFAINSSQQIEIYDGAVVTSTGTINLNEWNHVAVSRSGSTYYFFINGEASGTGSASNLMQFDRIGVLGTTNGLFEGYISDIRLVDAPALYTSAFAPPTAPLTPVSGTEFLCNFTNASIIDRTGSNVIETVGNAQVDTTTFKYGDGALYFDGTGDYLTIPASQEFAFGTGDFTIETWVNFDVIENAGVFHLASSYFPGDFSGLSVLLNTSPFEWRLYHKGSGYNTSVTPSANTWYHTALVRNSGTLDFYVNGTSIYSASDTTDYTGTYLVIGGSYGSAYVMDGYIDDFRITKGIARYTANFTPPTKSLPVIGV